MSSYNPSGISREEWVMSNPTVIDYHHQPATVKAVPPSKAPLLENNINNNFNDLVQLQLKMLSSADQSCNNLTSFGVVKTSTDVGLKDSFAYNPFVEDNAEDMEISDDESKKTEKKTSKSFSAFNNTKPIHESMEVRSGASFYKGLILYIPPFEQLSQSYRGSPAMKMLYASFEFSLKTPIRIESTNIENDTNRVDVTILFREHLIAKGSGRYQQAQVEASVRALELLSETCYTIQAKEDYFIKCKLVDAEKMKTLNLKKWEAVSEKYPKLLEITKESHIQKTFGVFLDNHTCTGDYEDVVCCNLTRNDVNNIKSVVEFFHLTMLPCSISTNLSKKETPCVVSIHKYTSAQKLLEILIESGGENDKFKLFPPDTFKDFYKLHYNYWDPAMKKPDSSNKDDPKTTLDDEEFQALIMKPYENTISDLFEKHKLLPKSLDSVDEGSLRKAGDDFMKEKLQIDMAQSKNLAPVERMQLLLKYMEQLQEYGSRVLTSGRQEMIKIYHNAIENLRKDLDSCRKDIEKEQKGSNRKSSPSSGTKRRSKSPKRSSGNTSNRSSSPRRRPRSRSPRNSDRPRRLDSPKRRARSKSPRRPRSRSPKRLPRRSPPPARRARSPPRAQSPGRRARSPPRAQSPGRRARSPLRGLSPSRRARSPKSLRNDPKDPALVPIFKDQFRRYVDILRRFRIEIEDTPIERRNTLKDKLGKCIDQLHKFEKEAKDNPLQLREYLDEIIVCKEELIEQTELISGKPGPNDLPRNITPPSYINTRTYEPAPVYTSYPQPSTVFDYGARMPPPAEGPYGPGQFGPKWF